MLPPRLLALMLTLTAVTAPTAATAQPDKKVDFAHDVLPTLKAKCAKCHTHGTYQAGIAFDTRAELIRSKVVAPGKSADSELIKRVTSTDPEKRMPPKGEPLSAKEVAALRAWIDEGVAWEPGFSFKPPAYVAPLKPRRPA